ncbi:hypothetical protein evm_002681 [Chilo suppressalis]|nr:hypothetical protein evm_002681 [Chilo suppressalis]
MRGCPQPCVFVEIFYHVRQNCGICCRQQCFRTDTTQKPLKKERTSSLKAGIAFVILLVLQVSTGDGDHLPSGATIADALAIGYRAILIDDASRGVDLADIESTKSTIINNNGVIITSQEVAAMVDGRDRRPELGYKLAMELKNAMEDKQ